MAIRTEIHDALSVVVVRLCEQVTTAQLHRVAVDLAGDPRYRETMDKLVDLREVTQVTLSSNDLLDFISRRAGKSARLGKTALIAASNYQFGMARMYEGITGNPPSMIGCFRDSKSALEWLGVPETLLEIKP